MSGESYIFTDAMSKTSELSLAPDEVSVPSALLHVGGEAATDNGTDAFLNQKADSIESSPSEARLVEEEKFLNREAGSAISSHSAGWSAEGDDVLNAKARSISSARSEEPEATKKRSKSFDNSYCPISTSVETVTRFNCMVAGGAGAGKSTFGYSAFRLHFEDFSMTPPDGPTEAVGECGRGETVIGNNRIILTVVDTVGHGGHDSSTHIDQILEYIEKQHLEYENNELYRNPTDRANDTRIHCLFYFFSPHRVHDVDISFLRRLQGKVNIVPIVSKADSLTIWELAEQLQLIRALSTNADIKYFDFAELDIDEGWLDTEKPFKLADYVNLANSLEGSSSMLVPRKESSPARPMIRNVFAVITNEREYLWGTASPKHSDTLRLHTALFGSLGKLALTTDEFHEDWRKGRSEILPKSPWRVVGTLVTDSFVRPSTSCSSLGGQLRQLLGLLVYISACAMATIAVLGVLSVFVFQCEKW